MWKLCLVVCILVVGTTSAIKLIGDYEEYSDYKHGEDVSGHWTGHQSDHAGEGRGQRYHHDHYYDNSGEAMHGNNKAGGHVKHHVTKGYKNFHHKDEVGHTTSYIDSSGDSRDHHGGNFLYNKWGSGAQTGVQGDHQESGFKGEKGTLEKKMSKEKVEDYKGNVGEFLYAKKPISNNKKFYGHVPLQYVPYPHYFY